MADVNGDSKPDIVFANDIQYEMGVLLNFGNGTFRPQTSYSTGIGAFPQCVSGKDVNGDGKVDIIVANNGGNNVGVFFNGGNGTFLPQTTYSTGFSSYPPSVSGADVNNDGAPDIVVANQNLGTVGVLLNFGNGTFRPQTTYSTGVGGGPTSVVVADVSGDGKPDIIVVNYNKNSIGVLFNIGNGTFSPVTTYSTGNNSAPRSVFVADVNSDNKPDLIIANQNANNVGVLFNVGNGTFGPQTTYYTGNNSSPISVSVADVNYDSKPDILVAHYGTNTIGLLLNVGDGTFLPQTTCPARANSRPQSISVSDVNNDSKVDVIVANSGESTVGVLLAT
jgi:hypothetical protein